MEMKEEELRKMLEEAKETASQIQDKFVEGKTLGRFYLALKMLVKVIENSKQVDSEMIKLTDELLDKVLETKLTMKEA